MSNQKTSSGVSHENNSNNVQHNNVGWGHGIISLFWACVTIYAIYLSFKCNKGFSLGGFLAALIFGPIYIVYKYATSWNKCFEKYI